MTALLVTAALVGSALLATGQSASAAGMAVPALSELDPYTQPYHPAVLVPGPPVGTGLPAGSPGAGTFTGTVESSSVSLPGARATAFTFDASGAVTFSRSVVADPDGAFTITGLPAGQYWLEYYDDTDPAHLLVGWSGTREFGWPDGHTEAVQAGETSRVFGYAYELSTVTGTVACSDGCDHPIDFSRASVDLYAGYGGWGWSRTPQLQVGVDPDGTFHLDAVHPGPFFAVVRYAGTDFSTAEEGVPFQVDEGQPASTSLALRQVRPDLHYGNPLGSAPEANVYGMYWDFLHRTPGTDDVKSWLAGFDYHNTHPDEAPQQWMARSFVQSDEYRLRRIDDAYRSILGRAPDAGGRAMWLTDMKLGYITTDDILKSLYESAEWYTNHGGTNNSFAKSLYNALLGRDGSSADYRWWGDLVATHGRNWVVDQFWISDETTGDRVSSMYATYLGRVPDADGLANWKSIDLRVGDSGARQGIVASQEYYWRCNARFDVSWS